MDLIPTLIVFGTAGVLALVVGLAIRGYRRTPASRAKREVVWTRAGASLVRLDDAIEESDIELGLAGAMYGGSSPRTLASARAKAADVRDAAFATYREALDRKEKYPSSASDARRVGESADRALVALEKAQASHKQWLTANADAPKQVASARARLNSLRSSLGDPTVLAKDLEERYAASELAPVQEATERLRSALIASNDAISRAESSASNPGVSVVPDLTEGEQALRDAEQAASAAEQAHKAVIDASLAVASEIMITRKDIARGVALRAQVPPEAAAKISEELNAALTQLDALESRAHAEPTAVVAEISRIRSRLDIALGSARSARDRIAGARNALPGTIATARSAIAHAEAIVSRGSSADARVRLTAAQDALASSRSAEDAVAALDAVRRAIRHAEDAEALANYARGPQAN